MADSAHSLPPGYRFYPTEEELISFYLHNKLHGNINDHLTRAIPLVHIHDFEPWQLPEIAGEMCKGKSDEQWFFFTPRQEREARGGRPNRTTNTGYWKATGSPGYVYGKHNRVIGVKKTMVFYKGKAPSGRKTKWKMNEYKAIDEAAGANNYSSSSSSSSSLSQSNTNINNIDSSTSTSSSSTPKLRHEFSLCRIYVKSGCLRAFDRRPSAGVLTTSRTTSNDQTTLIQHESSSHDHHVIDDGAAMISAADTAAAAAAAADLITVQNDENIMRMSSPECPSSSGDDVAVPRPQTHHVLGGEEAAQDWEMAIDDRSLWEWEQLNWDL